jgi:predicted DNA-binding transcriptional regulator AlpA
MMNNNGILHGLKQICPYIGMSKDEVREAVEHDGFPAIKTGSGWKSHEDSIRDWLKDQLIARKKKPVKTKT